MDIILYLSHVAIFGNKHLIFDDQTTDADQSRKRFRR